MQHAITLGSVPLGRYNGLPLRLHISFVLVGIFVLFFQVQSGGNHLGKTGVILLIWFAAVLLHEAGHCFLVHRIGGNNEMLVLTPFGGLSFHSFPQQAGKDLWVALSGPLMSFIGFTMSIVALGLFGDAALTGLWDDRNPNFSAEVLPIAALRLSVWINLGLVLVNILPAIPLDGGWILHALLWPALGDHRSWHVVRRSSQTTALGIFVLALVTGLLDLMIGNMPLWLPLTILAAYCFCFSSAPLSLHPLDRGSYAGEDPTADSSLRPHKVTVGNSNPQQHELSLEEQMLLLPTTEESQNEKADSAVDEVLQCVYDRGLASLTTAQRKVLQEAAKRYRSRIPK